MLRSDDYTDVNSVGGTVIYDVIFYMTLRTPNNRRTDTHNRDLILSVIINYSGESNRRVEIGLDIACDTGTDLLKDLIRTDVAFCPPSQIRPRLYPYEGNHRIFAENYGAHIVEQY